MSAEQKPLLANVQPITGQEPPPATPPRTLAQKILDIQNSVGVVKKQGKFGTEMGGGNYLRIEDAVVAVNKLMCSKGLILTGTLRKCERLPHEKTGKDGLLVRGGYISSVLMDWTVDDTETGESRTWTFPGDGYDGTDKSIYKAMTGCRKYAITIIFNLPIGNDVEEHGLFEPKESKAAQKNVAAQKIADAAGKGNKTAIDALSQIEPERKLIITRPESMNGHFIIASGFIAAPPLDKFFEDTGSKRLTSKTSGNAGWKVSADYEKGLIELCARLEIEVEG